MKKDITTWFLISVLVLDILLAIVIPSELIEHLPVLGCLLLMIAFLCMVALIVRLKCKGVIS